MLSKIDKIKPIVKYLSKDEYKCNIFEVVLNKILPIDYINNYNNYDIKECKDGDILYFYNGNQKPLYYYIDKNNNKLIKCLGYNNYFIPKEGIKYVILFGTNYYNHTLLEYIIIPDYYYIRHIHETDKYIEPSILLDWTKTSDIYALTLKLSEYGFSQIKYNNNITTFLNKYFVKLY